MVASLVGDPARANMLTALMSGREASKRLMALGVLAKDTHGATIRLAPPLCITADEVDWAVDRLAQVLIEAGAN